MLYHDCYGIPVNYSSVHFLYECLKVPFLSIEKAALRQFSMEICPFNEQKLKTKGFILFVKPDNVIRN